VPVATWFVHHRLWAMGMGVVVIVVLVAAGFWYLVLRSPGTQVGLRQALRLYRQGQSGADSGGTRLPPSGVYRYRTTGDELLSVGGIHRSFPGTTEMIVTDATCSTMTWEPLVQHVEGLVTCPAGGEALTMPTARSDETIAGTRTDEVISCPPTTYFLPPHPSAGMGWGATCHSGPQPVRLAGQVIGPSTVTVGGHPLAAVHTRITFTFSGPETGTNPTDYWLVPGDGLVLRERETVDLVQQAGPLGRVRYTESMTITLESTTPAS